MKMELVTLKLVTMMDVSQLYVKKMGVVALILAMSLLQVAWTDELIFAHSICRHGDRTASNSYQNDPQKSENDCDNAYGRLTNLGKQHQFEFGQFLRKRYAKLLGDGTYSSEKIYIRATDLDRTIMSALSALAGLFPPSGQQIWNNDIQWQPVPVHTIPLNLDYLLRGEIQCDRRNYLQMKSANTSAYTGIFQRYKTTLDALRKYTGMPLKTLTEIRSLQSKFWIQECRGFAVPAWINNQINDGNSDLNRLILEAFGFFTVTDELKKFNSGFLLKEIFDHFSSKLNSTLSPKRSLWLYFAHDSNIHDVISSLGIKMDQLPAFSSCVLFDLYQTSNKNPYVQFFYKNSTGIDDVPALLQIPKCGAKCPLKKLYSLYNKILPTKNFAEECALRNGEYKPNQKHY